MNYFHALGLVNMACCIAILFIALCRLNACTACDHWTVRLKWTLLVPAAVASGLQPLLWGVLVGPGQALTSACLLGVLLAGAPHWRAYELRRGSHDAH